MWIDNEMGCFERELVENSEGEATRQDALEEPGRLAFLKSQGRTSTKRK